MTKPGNAAATLPQQRRGNTAGDDTAHAADADARNPRPSGRAPGRRRRGGLAGRVSMPRLTSRLVFVGAALLVLQVVTLGSGWSTALVDLYSTVALPLDGAGIGLAVFLVILGAALARRKQVAWILLLVLAGLTLLTDLLGIAYLLTEGQRSVHYAALLVRFAVNLVTLGALVVALVRRRAEFRARRPAGRVRLALLTLLVGLAATFGAALGLTSLFPGELGGLRGRAAWIVRQLWVVLAGSSTDLPGARVGAPPTWLSSLIGLLVGLSLIAAVLVLLQSQRRAATMTATESQQVRALLADSTEDSLAYFATRRDRSAIFSPDGRAAVTYRVDLGVCLAAGDPIGPRDHWPTTINAWRALADTYGWTPAVLGASEAGAEAYAASGLDALQLGDEAVLHTRSFHLDAPDLRPVRQAVQRVQRSGYQTRVRRQRDLPPAERDRLRDLVDGWRDTDEERGFSMALGRFGEPIDDDCLVVEALFPDGDDRGTTAGLLSFVPWGTDGFSLDVMRRHPDAGNGTTELMVTAVLGAVRELGIRRVSFNFAVFRSAFEEGARIGAGPVLRLWRQLLLVASRWWQLESLYRSNVKYRPDWVPRFLCFDETRDIALVGAASGVAEGFIHLPRFLQPVALASTQQPEPAAPALPASTSATDPAVADPRRVPDQVRQRMQVRDELLARGLEPYPASFDPTSSLADLADLQLGTQASVAGRVLAVRDLGGVVFVVLQDWSGRGQLLLTDDRTDPATMADLRHLVRRGDHLGAEGRVVHSRSGELSLHVEHWTMTSKALRPLPNPRNGLLDPETRVRKRYLDLNVNPRARTQLAARSHAIRAVRDTLHEQGYLEVETPILQTVHGGANARPFRTHINAYDLDLYLRIAPELYLKRLMVGGVDRLFEIGRNFRNEGADATHNPEFTMLEAYRAHADYRTMRVVAQQLVTAAAHAVTGGSIVRGADHRGALHEVDLDDEWPVVTVHDALAATAGVDVTPDTSRDDLLALARRLQLDVDDHAGRGAVVLELYEHLVERTTIRPTFYTDFPADVSPLTRPHRLDDRLAERWDLVAFGAEIGTAYSELVDPVLQRQRLTEQSLQAAGGDAEAMELDEDFLVALEHGMPPSGGLGMGLDRLMMMLTASSIRETIAFPLVRPGGRR